MLHKTVSSRSIFGGWRRKTTRGARSSKKKAGSANVPALGPLHFVTELVQFNQVGEGLAVAVALRSSRRGRVAGCGEAHYYETVVA